MYPIFINFSYIVMLIEANNYFAIFVAGAFGCRAIIYVTDFSEPKSILHLSPSGP